MIPISPSRQSRTDIQLEKYAFKTNIGRSSTNDDLFLPDEFEAEQKLGDVPLRNLKEERTRQALAKEKRSMQMVQEADRCLSVQTAIFAEEVRKNPAFTNRTIDQRFKLASNTFLIQSSEEQNVFHLKTNTYQEIHPYF